MAEYQIENGWEDIEARTAVADATDRVFYEVQVPWLGDLWSYDKDALVRWLRRAADEVETLTARRYERDYDRERDRN